MAVEITREKDAFYGNCICMRNGICELKASIDFGPRIFHMSLIGEKNMFFRDENNQICEKGEKFDRYYYKGAAWHIYGGHRFWVAPESSPETYYPDNDPVEYEIRENTLVLRPPVQKSNEQQIEIAVTMAENSADVTLVHTLTNCGSTTRHIAPWSLSVCDAGSMVILPQNTRKTGLLSNRSYAFWEYCDLSDPRFAFTKKYLSMQQDKNCTSAFKFGASNEAGVGVIVNGCEALALHHEHTVGEEYPDGGCSFESYTSRLMLEAETLGRMTDLAPGKSITHTEKWEIRRIEPVSARTDAEFDRVFAAFEK